jgi:predicted kinase
MSKLIMMCGVPGSGKSTWVRNNFPDITPVSRDVIRFEILDERGGDYFDYEDEVFDKFIRQIIGSLVVDEITIADATHLNKKSRAKVLNKVRKFADEIEAVMMDVHLITALERNDLREGRAFVPRGVIRRMYFQMETPTKEEGFDKITFIREDEEE